VGTPQCHCRRKPEALGVGQIHSCLFGKYCTRSELNPCVFMEGNALVVLHHIRHCTKNRGGIRLEWSSAFYVHKYGCCICIVCIIHYSCVYVLIRNCVRYLWIFLCVYTQQYKVYHLYSMKPIIWLAATLFGNLCDYFVSCYLLLCHAMLLRRRQPVINGLVGKSYACCISLG
jgi:hypothetical protein